MKKYIFIVFLLIIFLLMHSVQLIAMEKRDEIENLKQEIRDLRSEMENQRKIYEEQIMQMKKRLDALSSNSSESDLLVEVEKARSKRTTSEAINETFPYSGKGLQSFNPDISVIIDSNYYNEDAVEAVSELQEEVPGFGHAHGDEHNHSHGSIEEGMNIREVEIYLSADVDPFFKAYTTLAFHEGGSEIEEAVFQTTSLPAGFQLLGGKFFSHFSRINSQHPHEWDFVDRPMVFEMSFGDHGLIEKGIQLSWLTPAPFHLLFGLEALQGENENMFNFIGGGELPDTDGPRLWVGWVKLAPNLPENHAMQMGFSFGRGDHQEAHDGDDDGILDHWLNGNSTFLAIDGIYKFDSGLEHGKGDITIQAEYFNRNKDLTVLQHDLVPAFVGQPREDKQDGYYVQALYGFMPRWRTGLRWEQAGLINESLFPTGVTEEYDASQRLSGMLDFSPTEFSRIRLQINRGEFNYEDMNEKYWQFYLQLMLSLGTHGAHKF